MSFHTVACRRRLANASTCRYADRYFYWINHSNSIFCRTCSTSIYGSAVCAYNMSAIDNAFNGPFKFQADASAAWTRVPNNTPSMQCGAGATSSNDSKMASSSLLSAASEMNAGHQRLLVDAQKYQMMDQAVQPTQLEPLIVAENERYAIIMSP